MDSKDLEIQRLKRELAHMQKLSSEGELQTQKMRDIRSRLDAQIDLFTRIHYFSQRAFHVKDSGGFYEIAAEGVVDIFQLEMGAVFMLDVSGEFMSLAGSCNLYAADADMMLPLHKEWLAKQEHWDFRKQIAIVPDVADPQAPWAFFAPAHVVYAPIFDNEQRLKGFVAGIITQSGKLFYDFYPREIRSSFTVYCQQLNGIYNNISAIGQSRQAMHAKNRFFANLSHEMRTPLNAIIGMVQIAQRSNDPDQYEKCIKQIGVSSKHLLELVNDVLDFSKIEEGKLVLEEQRFCARAVLENLVSQFKPQTEEKCIKLIMLNNLDTAAYMGDATRLSQVLLNLMSNAVKYTPSGGQITLSAEETSRQKDKSVVRFSVQDNGIGIDPAFLERLFKPFEQQDSSTARKYGGTGLGLAISQRIVEMMGGSIKIESEPERGSLFYFSIVLARAIGEETAVPEETGGVPDFSGKRLLVVDDMEINCEIVKALLEETGIRIDSVENGRKAVEMVENSAPGHYSLVFMDLQMPEMDGLDATREIRLLDRPDARTLPIIAMTANAFKEDVNDAINAGMDGHISKPVQYEAMLSAISQAVARKPL